MARQPEVSCARWNPRKRSGSLLHAQYGSVPTGCDSWAPAVNALGGRALDGCSGPQELICSVIAGLAQAED
jgi:hypothetical protein